MVNTILAKRVNHIVAKGDNPVWPKRSKSRGFSIIICLSGWYKNRIEGCGTQEIIIKVHNMTSDVIAKSPDYADRRELKSLSYFGI